jgi:hypothetical protein
MELMPSLRSKGIVLRLGLGQAMSAMDKMRAWPASGETDNLYPIHKHSPTSRFDGIAGKLRDGS